MSSNHTTDQLELSELCDESDLEKLLSPAGRISICGFGSLLSGTGTYSCIHWFSPLPEYRRPCVKDTVLRLFDQREARGARSRPGQLQSGEVDGFWRVFAHVAPICFERVIAKPETKVLYLNRYFESERPCEGETLIVTVFEIKQSEITVFIKRELEFGFLAVSLYQLLYFVLSIATRNSSESDIKKARRSIFNTMDDMVLIRSGGMFYLVVCILDTADTDRMENITAGLMISLRLANVLAAENLGEAVYDNFLDHIYLADCKTTIREYLETSGSGIM
ncbi:uncharacterized protein LOC116203263 [Punica granatum]|uniref:Uncharacterized protein LOC116203263 n=1 Tax=Punica granatum TaxID=22663 RepID=A0A6P8D8F3_PUNGR|nr:uncharacterized protein LOC116203263 [Punica granatum]